MIMETRFNPFLVTLSIVVAIFASYVALNLAHSVTQAKGRAKALWLACGSLAMGTGIWSMHFIGMLAFEMPGMTMAYDVPLMTLSVIVAVGGSALALYIISRPMVPLGSILAGGIAMAAAIAGMHYIGMYSMRMAATIKWNIFLVVLSVVIALVASFGALLISIRLRNKTDRLLEMVLASTMMGFAIAGMHYVGMYAASFRHLDAAVIESSNLLVSSGLAMAVIATTILILGLALASSVGQRYWAMRDRKANEILGKSEEKFRRLVEAVKDYAIIMLDPDGRVTTWNLGLERILGYADKEIIGKHVSVFYTNQDLADRAVETELNAARESDHFECEGERVRKDGSTFWASVVIAPLYDQDGRLSGFSEVMRDITQFKESERRMRQLNGELEERVKIRTQALEHQEIQLRTLANAVPVFLGQLDQNERFLFANEPFCKWFSPHDGVVFGKTYRSVMGDDRYRETEQYVKRALAGETVTFERESSSGDQFATFQVTFVPEFDDTKTQKGLVIVASDISKYKEIQEELRKAKEAAEVANAAKSAFLANMSHEIRTPLGVVLGFSELLLNQDLSLADRQKSAEIVKRNGQLLSNIINDILDLSKVEAGKLEIEKVEVSFSGIMADIASVLSLSASEKGIELKVTSEGVIPSVITTDPLRLRQILLNVVGNAIKFTSRGSVNVKIKYLPSSNGASNLAFIVSDTGVGIKHEQVERLFSPFSQADASTTRKFGGTGLGLALSKRLANALGGDVYLSETTPEIGSTFVVTIDPGSSEQVLFQSSEQPLEKPKPFKRDFGAKLNQLRILVVDDSPDNQSLIHRILGLAGALVETANNGREAVDKALKGNFSIVLMDLQMPEMDGYEATKVLREQGYRKPIIALTAHAMKEERQRSLQKGFDDHITKPIDRELLLKTLSEFSSHRH